MPSVESWIKQTLTDMRKLDRAAQRERLEALLDTLDRSQRAALRQEIEARQARVAVELRALQGRGADPGRKPAQKEAMLARYRWLLQIIERHAARPER